MEKGKLKSKVASEIENRRNELSELALKIHANPELGFHEFKAAEWLSQYLEKNGFLVERGVYDIPTSFKAIYGKSKPVIGLLAEYDALPNLGHACGHNIIATSSVGAGIGAKLVIDQFGGSVQVIGTPAEELFGGKAIMVNRGAFRDLDAAMIIHPEDHDTAMSYALACQTLEIEFFGKSAHAAARPEAGINALEAMLLSFASINALRQHIRSTARIHGIITDGGQAANIVPAHSAGSFIVRAQDDDYLTVLKEKVLNCFKSAALATSAELKYKWDDVCYATMRNSSVLSSLFSENMALLGRKAPVSIPQEAYGSTDMGNVSHLVPSIQPYVAIAPKGVLIHSAEFASAAASESGIKGMIDAAKALAMTVVDLLSNPELLIKAKEEFEQGKDDD
jgi:amidohydrolase